jgi:hypothetical protein
MGFALKTSRFSARTPRRAGSFVYTFERATSASTANRKSFNGLRKI